MRSLPQRPFGPALIPSLPGIAADALELGSRPLVQLRLPDATGVEHDVPVRAPVS